MNKMFKDRDPKKIQKLLNGLKEFKIDGYEPFLIYGTLLGAVREKGFIGHDNDVDLAYFSKYNKPEEVMEEALTIYKKLAKQGKLVKWFNADYKGKTDFTQIKDASGQAHVQVNGITVDLFTTWEDEEGNFWLFEFGKVGKNVFFPLEEGEINGVSFKIPKNSDVLLKFIYGDWETPRKEKPSLPRKIWLPFLIENNKNAKKKVKVRFLKNHLIDPKKNKIIFKGKELEINSSTARELLDKAIVDFI